MNRPSIPDLLADLENGEPVEHLRPLRADPSFGPKLVVPQSIRRVYRGLHGDFRTVQPLLGTAAYSDNLFGTVNVAYTPFKYRLDVAPRLRTRRGEAWSIYSKNAAYFSIPPLKGRRPAQGVWSLLLMYEFRTEEYRPHFWINPLDRSWDLDTRSEIEFGQTFYVNYRPLPVTCAFARIDRMTGTMKQRGRDAQDALCSLLADLTPSDEWHPPPRPEKPPAKKRYKLRLPSSTMADDDHQDQRG